MEGRGRDNDSTKDRKLKVFAYCDKRKLGLVSRSKDGAIAPMAKASLTPKCPKGGRAFSGGYESTIDTGIDGCVCVHVAPRFHVVVEGLGIRQFLRHNKLDRDCVRLLQELVART